MTRQVAGLLLFLGTLFAGCKSSPPHAEPTNAQRLEQLASWMSGVFSNREQAEADQEFVGVQLVMRPIWPGRTDGKWVYVEQSLAQSSGRPFRQRVYHLAALDDGRIECSVYLVPGDPSLFAGAWRLPHPLENLRPDMLREREGCALTLEFHAEHNEFVGGTEGKDCSSERAGAVYATNEIAVGDGVLVSLDRGFDKDDKQVWGTRQGYRFVREP